MIGLRLAAFTGAAALVVAGRPAAARPTLSGPASTFGAPGGRVLLHYATAGADAVPITDADASGVSDFVEAVAAVAEEALARYADDGFRAPKSDLAVVDNGGDGRVDLYLRDLQAADGNTATDRCEGGSCIAYAVVENDYAGFGYPSVTEGIRSVVPHELFHVVQYAYSADQPAQWTEGTAVWATEHLYGAGNSDFERFLGDFLTKTYRPFERASGGFGDLYIYGAALFPRFLEDYAGLPTLLDVFEATASAPFLDAVDATVAGGLGDTFAEFTRWNLFTGGRAGGGMYAGAEAWEEAPLEDPIVAPAPDTGVQADAQIEGLSARYVPVTLGEGGTWRITVNPSGRNLRAWVTPFDGGLADGLELVASGDNLAIDLPAIAARDQRLVVTGLSRNTITTAIPITLAPVADDGGDAGGCCSANGGGTSSALLAGALAALLVRRRRR